MTREQSPQPRAKSTLTLNLTLAWLAVGIPLLWGVVETLRKAMALFA